MIDYCASCAEYLKFDCVDYDDEIGGNLGEFGAMLYVDIGEYK